jgi:hypothetical protein
MITFDTKTPPEPVAEKGVVFPAIPSATDKAEAAFKAKNVDVTAFTVHIDEKTTFLFPITDYASQIERASCTRQWTQSRAARLNRPR